MIELAIIVTIGALLLTLGSYVVETIPGRFWPMILLGIYAAVMVLINVVSP